MEYFFILFSIASISIIVFLYRKLLWFKQFYNNTCGELANKISEFGILAEKCRQESLKFQEVSARNINLTGQYQELLRVSQTQNFNINELNGRINEILSNKDKEIKSARLDATSQQKSVIKGKLSEEMAVLLPGWKYNCADARFYGSPIDFLIMRGLSEDNITELIFLDVKTNKAVLSKRQRQIRNCIKNNKISWDTFHISDKTVYSLEDINNTDIQNNE